jgi:hypothetical protein
MLRQLAGLILAAFCASPTFGAAPRELIDTSDEPMESDIIGDISYSTVLDSSLRSDFLGSSRAERTAAIPSYDFGSYMSNVDAQGLLSLVALIVGVALVAVTVERFRNRRSMPPLSPRRLSSSSRSSMHRPHRSSPLAASATSRPLATSPSWPNLPQKSTFILPA